MLSLSESPPQPTPKSAPIKRNLLANYAGQGWSAIMNIVFVPVYISVLGIEAYALIGIYAVLQAWLALLDLGMSPTVSRELARFRAGAASAQATQDLLRSMEVICALIALTALAIIAGTSGAVAAHWLKSTLPHATVQTALAVMGAVVALRFGETFYRSALYGLDHQVWYNALNAVTATLRFGGGACCIIFVSADITTFFLWQLGISIVATSIAGWKVHASIPKGERPARFSRAAISRVAAFATGMLGINLLAMTLSQADKVVLSKSLPLSVFGIYAFATTVCGVIVAATGPITQAIYPTLSRLEAEEDHPQFDRVYHHASQLIAVAATTIGAMLTVFPLAAIFAWSGNRELATQVAPILRVLAAGMLINSIMQIPYFATLARGETRLPVKLNAIAVAIVLPALLFVVPRYGAMGAAWVWLLNNFFQLLIGTPLLHRYFIPDQFKGWAWRDTAPALICGLTMALCLHFASTAFALSRSGWLVYLVATGGLVLLAASLGSPDVRRTAFHIIVNRVKNWRSRTGVHYEG